MAGTKKLYGGANLGLKEEFRHALDSPCPTTQEFLVACHYDRLSVAQSCFGKLEEEKSRGLLFLFAVHRSGPAHEVVRWLLEDGVDVNFQSPNLQQVSALQLACANTTLSRGERVGLVAILVNWGADSTLQDRFGRSAEKAVAAMGVAGDSRMLLSGCRATILLLAQELLETRDYYGAPEEGFGELGLLTGAQGGLPWFYLGAVGAIPHPCRVMRGRIDSVLQELYPLHRKLRAAWTFENQDERLFVPNKPVRNFVAWADGAAWKGDVLWKAQSPRDGLLTGERARRRSRSASRDRGRARSRTPSCGRRSPSRLTASGLPANWRRL